MKKCRVAIVYDWIDSWGGVERLLLVLHRMYPDAEFFTSYVDYRNAAWAQDIPIKTSFIQSLPDWVKKNRVLSLPLYPRAFESFNFTGYDLVISVTSAFAKSVITKPGILHICYLLTPTRYLWHLRENYISRPVMQAITAGFSSKLREYDYLTAQRPDHIITLSQAVQLRCRKYYGREAEVIYPPFPVAYWESVQRQIKTKEVGDRLCERFSYLQKKKYFLVVSRLVPYKNIALAVKAWNTISDSLLVIVGKGPEKSRLESQASKRVIFLEEVTDAELAHLYTQAQALIMPQEEDFGYTALESQFFSCPVITYAKGGASETVIHNKTGLVFEAQTVSGIVNAVERFAKIQYNILHSVTEVRAQHIATFSEEQFVTQFRSRISQLCESGSSVITLS